MEEKTFFENLTTALAHIFFSIVYILFIVPFDLYAKAAERLAEQRNTESLNIASSKSSWPFFTFLKRVTFDFYFDFATILSWIIAIIVGIILFIAGFKSPYRPFEAAMTGLVVSLIVGYYAPIYFAIARDATLLFFLMPIRKFISWLNKPAQHVDLTMDKESSKLQ